MRRRTLDIAFSVGGIALASALLVLAVVFMRDANFAKSYVAEQLGEQKITFKPADQLTDAEKESACLVEFAGQPLTTGKQAECYANDFIGLHLRDMGDGMTYAELGAPQRELRTQVAEAQENNDPSLAALESELAEITATRNTKFQGETLRGLLLTSYGFSVFGEKAALAATVLFAMGGVLGLLAIAGFVHAFTTPRDEQVHLDKLFAHEHVVEPAKRRAGPSTSGAKARPKAKATASRTKR